MRSSTEHRSLPRIVYTVTVDVVNALIAERELLKAQIDRHDQELKELRNLHNLAATPKPAPAEADGEDLSVRRETTYLYIVGGLLNLLVGRSPSGQPYSSFRTQDAVVSALVAHYGDRPGIGERTLHGMFAAANKKLGSP